MLRKLEIQNYAIIDKLEIDFPTGLTIITGETGAGKSILLGALGLIMGKRADTKVLFDQERKCFVEATFAIADYQLHEYFTEEGLDYDDELIIRREIAPGGKSRAYINDSPITLDILTTLTENLIDIHQQFDTLDIQKPVFQLRIIDALAGNKNVLEQYSNLYKDYRQTCQKLELLKEENRNAQQEVEFLNFQIAEFDQADLKPNEQDELEMQLQKLTSAEDIIKNCSAIVQAVEEGENAILGQLQFISNQFGSIKNLDKNFSDIYDRLLSVREELMDISKDASRISDSTEYDAAAIETTTTRLNIINRLQKKHGVITMDDLLKTQAEIKDKLNKFGDLTSDIENLELEISKKERSLKELAQVLSQARKKVIPSLEKDVHNLLTDLSMNHAYIKVQTGVLSSFSNSGLDDISILFAPNKGSDFLPLKDTASGGEMSRLTLIIKSLVAGALTLPTLIFDEIDAGVSGDIAGKMGEILNNLANKHQIIAITHSPQIAAKAMSHYWVYKNDTESRTVTAMRQLDQGERVYEIAKMLSGNPPTEAAKANARELIGQ
ncbi:MAG TPA: DNA repair protein RecN [Saprospiraceae bacterium]|nr:DNA repair protein RecN [Saprospiraceae bacterium]